ncbi:MAG TPA: hypothetical protein VH593_09290 [Ktedonobacteraceae bacterium]
MMVCIVCEQEVGEHDIAEDIRPGDWVICRECDKITPNRKQAIRHWFKRCIGWERHQKIEETAKMALVQLTHLENCGALTDEEAPMIEALRNALERKEEHP